MSRSQYLRGDECKLILKSLLSKIKYKDLGNMLDIDFITKKGKAGNRPTLPFFYFLTKQRSPFISTQVTVKEELP